MSDAPRPAALVGEISARGGAAALRRQQTLTIVLLFGGYAAYYFCRADLSVATPLLVAELRGRGAAADVALARIGTLSSLGVLAYALGKLFLTGLGDLWGGRRSFLVGLGGATLFTLVFAMGGGLPLFTLAWIGNRLTQSIGWAGLIKVCSRWFDFSAYGTVIGILSLSYLVGDAVARESMGALIGLGVGWRSLFGFGAAVAGLMFVANALWLRESRTERGHGEAHVNPLNLYAAHDARPTGIRALLRPLVTSRAFVLVCVLSFGCTVVRETFNTWTPMYLSSYLGYSAGGAASWSALFPALGAVSVLGAGWLSDRFGTTGRSLLLLVGLALAAIALSLLVATPPGAAHAVLPLVLIGVVALSLLGPYSYLGGAIALDFGGRQAGAAASGIIDGIGYLGGVLAGDTVARIAGAFGWHGVFVALATVSAASAVAAGFLHVDQRRRAVRAAASP